MHVARGDTDCEVGVSGQPLARHLIRVSRPVKLHVWIRRAFDAGVEALWERRWLRAVNIT
jgi:hypothetical protein